MSETIGFIGVGDMGGAMARRALDAGTTVWVHDLDAGAAQRLAARGAKVADSLKELCQSTDQIHVVVVTDAQVRAVVKDLLPVARPGTRILVHSTINPETPRELARASAERGLRFLDAPVSGSIAKSAGGGDRLIVMVGGDEDDLAAASQGILSFATEIFHVGAPGDAQVVKLANNLVAIINSVVLHEGVRLAGLAGVDAGEFLTIVKQAAADSWAARHGFAPRVWSGASSPDDYSTGSDGFIAVLQKDLGLALEVGDSAGLDLPVLKASMDAVQGLFG